MGENVKYIILAVTAALIIWDIVLAIRPPAEDTISEVIRKHAHKYPLIPFAFGVIMGHWWW